MVKNLPANAEDLRDAGLIPGSGRSPGREHRGMRNLVPRPEMEPRPPVSGARVSATGPPGKSPQPNFRTFTPKQFHSHLQPQATNHLLSVLTELSFLDISCKWSHALCGLCVCFFSFSRVSWRFFHVVAGSTLFFFIAEKYIPLCGL